MSKAAALCADQMKEQVKRSEKEKQAIRDRTHQVSKEIEAKSTEREKLRERVGELGAAADVTAREVQEARTKRDHLRGLLDSLKERKAKLEHSMAESEDNLSRYTLGLGGVHKASSVRRRRAHYTRDQALAHSTTQSSCTSSLPRISKRRSARRSSAASLISMRRNPTRSSRASLSHTRSGPRRNTRDTQRRDAPPSCNRNLHLAQRSLPTGGSERNRRLGGVYRRP